MAPDHTLSFGDERLDRLWDEMTGRLHQGPAPFDFDFERPAAGVTQGQAKMHLQRAEYEECARICEAMVERPHYYKAVYRMLFQAYRALNKVDLANGNYATVAGRVERMFALDGEMVTAMATYWSWAHNKTIKPGYFRRDRNLKVTDAKAMAKAGEALGDRRVIAFAKQLLKLFPPAKPKAGK